MAFEGRLIGLSTSLDVATIRVSEEEAKHLGSDFVPQGKSDWPPHAPDEDDLAVLAGEQPLRTRALSLNDLIADAISEVTKPTELDLSAEDPIVQLDVLMAREALTGVSHFMAGTEAVSSIRVATRVVGSAVALTLEDDGASPSAKELSALFAPFTKLDRRPKLGLELTRIADLASRSGGYVTAGVREPRGLRIVLTLPASGNA